MCKHFLVLMIVLTSGGFAAGQRTRTIIYDGVATEVSVSAGAANDLWITASDLTRATRLDRKSTRLNSSHVSESRMPSSA